MLQSFTDGIRDVGARLRARAQPAPNTPSHPLDAHTRRIVGATIAKHEPGAASSLPKNYLPSTHTDPTYHRPPTVISELYALAGKTEDSATATEYLSHVHRILGAYESAAAAANSTSDEAIRARFAGQAETYRKTLVSLTEKGWKPE